MKRTNMEGLGYTSPMSEITLCKGGDCPKKETCRRYTTLPVEYRQSWYFGWPPIRGAEDCEYYWPVESEQADPGPKKKKTG